MSTLFSLEHAREPPRHRVAVIAQVCSPPFAADEGTDFDFDPQIYRTCPNDDPGQATQITTFSGGGASYDDTHNPVLSPNGQRILFEAANASTGFTEIWVVNRAPFSTATQLIADASNYVLMPSWAPDNDTFAYVHGSGGALTGGTIYKDQVSAIGSPTSLKSAAGGMSPFRPQFNFDGSRIAYMWDQDIGSGASELRVMDDDGTNDASVDTINQYRKQGGQHSWANAMNVIAYDDGAPGSNAAYVINDDGTGKTQINALGSAAGGNARISHLAWPPDDSYVIQSTALGFAGMSPIRAELDGSNTTTLNIAHGAYNTDYFRQILVYKRRLWMIESATVLGSMNLTGGDYRNELTITGAEMSTFGTGDGWYFQ